jgi:hypothetical protein
MTTAIPDLWAEDIKVDVLPPLAILKAQEGLLARKTQGMLEAKLTTLESENLVQHQLDLVAPSLNFYRERLLTATHDRVRLYPVVVTAECFTPKPQGFFASLQTLPPVLTRALIPESIQRKAATEEEFIQLVREVLQSEEVRALISSLIACINQGERERQTNGTVERENGSEGSQTGSGVDSEE